MSYDLDQFIADCRTFAEARSRPRRPREGPRASRAAFEQPGFRRATIAATMSPRGLKVLYEDPELGFQVLAHINDKARVSPPHDHGASWAIYGQATIYTDMIEWEREDDGERPQARQAQAGKEVPPRSRPGRHLPGRHDPLDRLSGPAALRARHRHQSRQDQPHPHRPEDRRGAADDAAAGDVGRRYPQRASSPS